MPVDKFGRDASEGYVSDTGVSVRYINNNFLRKDGSGTATGPLDMGKNRISNVVDPIDEQDVATKHYVDDVDATLLPRDGSRSMQAAIDMDGNRITNVGLPQQDTDGVNRGFVSQQDQGLLNTAMGLFLAVDGSARPVADISWGDRRITDLGDPQHGMDAANKMYVDNLTSDTLRRSGDTMTGDLDLGGRRITDLADPQHGMDAANKKYVDNMGRRVGSFVKSMVGYIPSLSQDVTTTGFKARASSYYAHGGNQFYPFHAFNTDNALEWATMGKTEDFWLSIECPHPVRVWQILMTGRRGRTTERLQSWRFEGSKDDETWVTLFAPPNPTAVGILTTMFPIPFYHTPFRYYRLYVLAAEGVNPGLNYMQLYVYNEI